jgi:hypothetical protein
MAVAIKSQQPYLTLKFKADYFCFKALSNQMVPISKAS